MTDEDLYPTNRKELLKDTPLVLETESFYDCDEDFKVEKDFNEEKPLPDAAELMEEELRAIYEEGVEGMTDLDLGGRETVKVPLDKVAAALTEDVYGRKKEVFDPEDYDALEVELDPEAERYDMEDAAQILSENVYGQEARDLTPIPGKPVREPKDALYMD